MRQIWLVLLLAVAGNASLAAQTAAPTAGQTSTPPPPQSARQALIEMFLGKGNKDFEKHLPEAAHQALIHKGETADNSVVLKISTIGREMVAQGEHIETFDVGPTLLINTQNNGHERIEVAVEHDSLLGEEDEIELSIHYYKDGQLQTLPVVPGLLSCSSRKRKSGGPSEVTVAAHVPLTTLLIRRNRARNRTKRMKKMRCLQLRRRRTILSALRRTTPPRHPDRGDRCSIGEFCFPQTPAEEGAPPCAAEAANEESRMESLRALRLCGEPGVLVSRHCGAHEILTWD